MNPGGSLKHKGGEPAERAPVRPELEEEPPQHPLGLDELPEAVRRQKRRGNDQPDGRRHEQRHVVMRRLLKGHGFAAALQ